MRPILRGFSDRLLHCCERFAQFLAGLDNGLLLDGAVAADLEETVNDGKSLIPTVRIESL